MKKALAECLYCGHIWKIFVYSATVRPECPTCKEKTNITLTKVIDTYEVPEKHKHKKETLE